MRLEELITEESDIDDKSTLLGYSEEWLDSDSMSDSFGVASSIDEIVDSLDIGIFHYLIIIACGLCYSGYATYYQSLGLVIVTACDLNVIVTNKGWLSINFLLGLIIGSSLFGRLADMYGRRKVLIISVFINLITVSTFALVYDYTTLIVMAAMIGFSHGGIFTTVHSYVMEFFPRSYRGKAGVCLSISQTVGSIFSSATAIMIFRYPFQKRIGLFLLTNWRLYLLIMMSPTLIGLIMLLFMPDSLRFALSKPDMNKFMMIWNKINQMNSYCRHNYRPNQQFYAIKSSYHMRSIGYLRQGGQSNNFIHHIRKLMGPPWRTRLFLLSIAWFGYYVGQQGFTTWLPTIISYYVGGQICRNHHVIHNISLNGITRLPTTNHSHCYSADKLKIVIVNLLIGNILSTPISLLCILLINRIGRKMLYCLLASVSGLTILTIWLIDNLLFTVILSTIFMSFTTNAWIPCKIWSSELFCTEIRSTAVGLLNVMGNIGSIMAMMIFIFLFHVNCTATFVSFSLLGLLSVLVTLFLPDTTTTDIR